MNFLKSLILLPKIKNLIKHNHSAISVLKFSVFKNKVDILSSLTKFKLINLDEYVKFTSGLTRLTPLPPLCPPQISNNKIFFYTKKEFLDNYILPKH